MPVLARCRSQAKAVLCKSNVRQLVLANDNYASDNGGFYFCGSEDILSSNLHRWYGRRSCAAAPFDITTGPLYGYADISEVCCPVKQSYVHLAPDEVNYDCGSGGFGYNLIYIGSKVWSSGYGDSSFLSTASRDQIRRPDQTLMFADTAMATANGLTEYSFAEPRYFVLDGVPQTGGGWDPSPSLHFRHLGRVNIGFADGHAGGKKLSPAGVSNSGLCDPESFDIGWFAPLDNSFFDLD